MKESELVRSAWIVLDMIRSSEDNNLTVHTITLAKPRPKQ